MVIIPCGWSIFVVYMYRFFTLLQASEITVLEYDWIVVSLASKRFFKNTFWNSDILLFSVRKSDNFAMFSAAENLIYMQL